jgi:hypothetical protein
MEKKKGLDPPFFEVGTEDVKKNGATSPRSSKGCETIESTMKILWWTWDGSR